MSRLVLLPAGLYLDADLQVGVGSATLSIKAHGRDIEVRAARLRFMLDIMRAVGRVRSISQTWRQLLRVAQLAKLHIAFHVGRHVVAVVMPVRNPAATCAKWRINVWNLLRSLAT